MTLERCIGVLFLAFCIAYGYTAFVTMQDELLPFELGMSFLPNSLPKALSIAGGVVALFVIFGGRAPGDAEENLGPVDFSSVKAGYAAQAVALLVSMIAYALLLRPLGFIGSTSLFLIGTALILGERKLLRLVAISVTATCVVWFLVERMLEIVLRPWPDTAFLSLLTGA